MNSIAPSIASSSFIYEYIRVEKQHERDNKNKVQELIPPPSKVLKKGLVLVFRYTEIRGSRIGWLYHYPRKMHLSKIY